MSNTLSFDCKTLLDTQNAAMEIAQQLTLPDCVYLYGDLGAGKTTLCQSIIQAFGYNGAVTSPTYNLVHEYSVELGTIYHMDLYRLQDPEELAFLALADLWTERSLFLIEWPERGQTCLPKPTQLLRLEQFPDHRQITLEKPV